MSERVYITINEAAAKQAHQMMSFRDYVPESRTNAYRKEVDEAYDLAEEVRKKRGDALGDRAWALAQRYAKNLGKYYNEESRIGCMCPSVMISGAGNFPVKKKEKQNAAADKNREFWNYCQSIRGKISNLLYSKEVIKSDDENVVEALTEKIESLKESQENMKEINKYYRKHKTLEGCDLLPEKELRNVQESMQYHSWDESPFPSYALQNNLANIKRYEQRLKSIKETKEKGSSEAEFGTCKVIENAECMRIQIVFEEKPEEAIRIILKSNGFRWSPKNGAWQRNLNNNGRYAAKRVLKELGEAS